MASLAPAAAPPVSGGVQAPERGEKSAEVRGWFVNANPKDCAEWLRSDHETRAHLIGSWLRELVGATSATAVEMRYQDSLIAALDSLALWQQHQARKRGIGILDISVAAAQFSVIQRLPQSFQCFANDIETNKYILYLFVL